MFAKEFFCFVFVILSTRQVLAHDLSLDIYKSASSTQASFDYQYIPVKVDSSAGYQFSLGAISRKADVYNGLSQLVSVSGREFYGDLGYRTESDSLYEIGLAHAVESDVDVVSKSIFLASSQNYYSEGDGAVSKFKFKVRLDVEDILHTPPSAVSVDTRILQSSLKAAGHFYFDKFNLSLGYKKYFYSKDLTTFVNNLDSVTTNNQTAIFSEEAASYSDSVISAGGSVYLSETLSFDVDYSVSQPVLSSEPVARGYFLDLNVDVSAGIYFAVGFGQTTAASTVSSASHIMVGASF